MMIESDSESLAAAEPPPGLAAGGLTPASHYTARAHGSALSPTVTVPVPGQVSVGLGRRLSGAPGRAGDSAGTVTVTVAAARAAY